MELRTVAIFSGSVASVIISTAILLFRNTPIFGTLILIAILIVAAPVAGIQYFTYRKIKNIEERFPDFLRDLAEAGRARVTLTKAIESAAKSDSGPLSAVVKEIATQVSWGVSFEKALVDFAKRYKSDLIQRSVTLILEASKAGGALIETLDRVARDARQIKEIEKKRMGQMRPYLVIMYVTYLVFLGIVVVLLYTLIPALGGAGELGAARPGLGPIRMVSIFTVGITIEEFKSLFLQLTAVEGIFCGLLAGQLGEGSLVAGLRHVAIFLLIGFFTFQLLVY